MDMAISLDSTSTFAYFNRAIMYYEQNNYNAAMADLDRVLKDEPGNALTLYNRSLIHAQVGNYEDALQDMDRVININPGNVLAYYNRASYFVNMERWRDALEDYDKAIDLYPDFAKAYMNRSYVENMLGMKSASKKDYETAQKKISEYRSTVRFWLWMLISRRKTSMMRCFSTGMSISGCVPFTGSSFRMRGTMCSIH